MDKLKMNNVYGTKKLEAYFRGPKPFVFDYQLG